jgi:hypothetical protein
MDRRHFLTTCVGVSGVLAGCTGDGESSDPTENDPSNEEDPTTETETETQNDPETDTETETETDTETETEADAVLSYEVTEGSNWDGDLPDLYSDWMKWVVLSFDVEQGEVSMEDLWFRSRIDTGERYQPADAQTNNALENGIENRGSVLEGGSADILYKAPSFADSYTWNLSGLRRQTVDGENIQLEEPGEDFYGDVTVSIDVQVTQSSDIITPEAEEFREEGQYWGIVSIEVIEGNLNVEDVWFRSGLEVGNRRASIDYGSNRSIKRGMRSRGEIKEGYTGHALYLVSEDADDASWYTDEMRQSVTIE